MGYATKYTLTTTPKEARKRVVDALMRVDNYDPFEEPCKWYDHEDDIVQVSCEMPGVLICVRGVGKEPEDEWVLYAHAGVLVKFRRQEWTPPPPPPEMVKARATAYLDAEERAEYERLKKKFGDV